MRPIVTDRLAWSVCRSICHTSEPYKKRLNWSRCRLGWGLGWPWHPRRHYTVRPAKMAESIDLLFGLWSLICQVAPMCPHWSSQRRNLANTIEPPICGGDAALLQITLTTCYVFLFRYFFYNKTNKNSSGDEIANVNFCTTTTYM